ncbi:LCP2 [Symbiodinium sp. CCMP2456]|nr:LCP2 [Symbiodinium sp. CCMP2456]
MQGAHKGTPLCKRHLTEMGRSSSPAPKKEGPNPKLEEPILSSVRRSLSVDSHRNFGERAVRFQDPAVQISPKGGNESAEFEAPTRAERTAHPRAGAPALVRIRPFFGKGATSAWYIFMGVVEISPDSRRSERGVLRVPSLDLRVSLPWHCLGDPPKTDSAGRYPRSWLQEFLHSVPKDLEERGVSIQATLLAPSSSSWGYEWEGRGVVAQDAPPFSIKPDCLRQVTSVPEITLLPHEDCRMLRAEGEGNPLASAGLFGLYWEQVSSNGEAIALVAGTFGLSPEKAPATSQDVDPLAWGPKTLGQLGETLGVPPLPPPPLPPQLGNLAPDLVGTGLRSQRDGGHESGERVAKESSDCVTARTEQVEAWGPPTEHKIEGRVKAPSTFLTWLRYAENAVKVFGSAYGLEHVQERMKFLKALQEAHEEDEHAFPFKYCMELYEARLKVYDLVKTEGLLDSLQGFSDHLKSHAQACLDKMGHKAGLDSSDSEEVPTLEVVDLQDKLPLGEDLGHLLGSESEGGDSAALEQAAEGAARVIRDLTVGGWGAFLEESGTARPALFGTPPFQRSGHVHVWACPESLEAWTQPTATPLTVDEIDQMSAPALAAGGEVTLSFLDLSGAPNLAGWEEVTDAFIAKALEAGRQYVVCLALQHQHLQKRWLGRVGRVDPEAGIITFPKLGQRPIAWLVSSALRACSGELRAVAKELPDESLRGSQHLVEWLWSPSSRVIPPSAPPTRPLKGGAGQVAPKNQEDKAGSQGRRIQRPISAAHADYLKKMANEGVPSRREQPLVREDAKNHGSVYGYEEELLQKTWKDAAYGAALFIDPNDPVVEELLKEARVAESPLGRVPKQNPDRTISAEGRPINDMRRQNEASLKKGARREMSLELLSGIFSAHGTSRNLLSGWRVSSSLAWPPKFVAWSSAARSHHGAYRPSNPAFDDVVPIESKWLMDDGVAVEPMVGTRIQQSLDLLDSTMKLVWGPEGVNVEKMAEEGEPSTSQLLWGLHMDFDDLTVTLPEPKRIKAKYLLNEPALARGNKQLPLGLLQEVIGCAQYWSVVCPELVPHLPSLYHLLKGNLQGTRKSAQARKQDTYLQVEAASESEADRRWEDFWDALDFVRLQLESPLTTSFSAAFEKLLPLRERLALPGVTARTRITGGDATLGRIGALRKDRAFHASEAGPYAETLRRLADAEDELEIISIMELLAFVALACERGDQWRGELVLYVTDNANVRSWLFKRRPSNRIAGLLIRLVQRLEAERGFSVHPIYIRTYRNHLADWRSREDLQQASQELERKGWVNASRPFPWETFLRDAARHSLVMPLAGDPLAKTARQLTHLGDSPGRTLRALCIREDPKGEERAYLLRLLKKEKRWSRLLVDAPRHLDGDAFAKQLEVFFVGVRRAGYLSSHLGALSARRRQVIWCWREGEPEPPGSLENLKVTPPPALQLLPLGTGAAEAAVILPGTFVQEPNIVTTGDPRLPHACGHLKGKGLPPKCIVHRVTGPACAFVGPMKDFRGPGGTLVAVPQGVRPLAPGEVARAQGLSPSQWQALQERVGAFVTWLASLAGRLNFSGGSADDAENDLGDELNDEEKAEVRRIEKECTDLEKQLCGLSATQQRTFLERLADNSAPVVGGHSEAATADKDPKYHVDRAEVGHVVAFQRHRSRLRAIQHQLHRGSVAPQPRIVIERAPGALPPMMSLGREHRLRLLRRLHEFERAGVEWTQEEIEASLTMEQFLDYIE